VLRRLSLQTGGESHGRGMLAVLTGLPAGLPLDTQAVDAMLRRRQGGFGRSARQRLEHDRVDVLAGVWRGKTSGAPLVLAVWNRDDSLASKASFSVPRPGHGDLAGAQKFGDRDMRPVLERASARETAARVAAGGVAASALGLLGVQVFAHVVALGGVACAPASVPAASLALRRRRDRSDFYALGRGADARLRRAVLAARRAGDTLGGRFEVLGFGVPPGLGSLDGVGSRLDARLGAALLSIPGVKAVEIGDGVAAASRRGSEVHDALRPPGPHGPRRATNRAGGVEAGLSNGEPIVARAFMKPIPTLARPLNSWDFARGRAEPAFYERADVTSVPAASVVGEAMLALVLLDALLEKTGGDTLAEVRRALAGQRRTVSSLFGARRRGAAAQIAGRRRS
jgi:chorismate synthase